MPLFNKRLIQRSRTLGERLKKVRQEAGLSLEEVEQKIQIRKRYLEAIEQGDYSTLPGPVYIESFLKKYAEFLKVSSEFVLDLYHQQDKKVLKNKYRPDTPLSRQKLPKEIITPKLIRNVIIAVAILACLTYLGFEVTRIFSPPDLVVASPEDFVTVHQGSIEIRGKTEPEATLTINGKRIFLDEQGDFLESINLDEGLNTITISATKKRSKANVATRHVLFKKLIE